MKNQLHRWVYWPIWFIVVPLALAAATVSLLSASGPAIPEGLVGRFLFFVQDQKVPAMIVFFTVYEMALYKLRYTLPFAAALGMAGRPGLPRERMREYEHANQLLEEAERVLKSKKSGAAKGLSAEAHQELQAALDTLAEAMQASPFSMPEFDEAYDAACHASEKHLARYRTSEVREYSESIFIAVGVALLLRAFLLEAFKIPSGSMLPTLQIHDHIFVNKLSYGPKVPFTNFRLLPDMPPKRGDIVVFEYPDPVLENPRTDYIKRVMALPGDVLEVHGGHPVINGFRIPSCYVGVYQFGEETGYVERGDLFVEYLGDNAYLTLYSDTNPQSHQGPYHVAQGEFWVMGDNRNNSADSRAWRHGRGAGVPFANVKGKAMFVWLGFNSTGKDPLGVTWDRLFTDVMGTPRLPKEADPKLTTEIQKCLATRPQYTTPPDKPPAELLAKPPSGKPVMPHGFMMR